MRRGTTPTNTFTTDTDITSATAVYITYKQNGKTVFEKTLEDLNITAEEIEVTLTQAETLALNDKQDVDIQIRVKFPGNEAIASNIIKTTVGRILKDGEI